MEQSLPFSESTPEKNQGIRYDLDIGLNPETDFLILDKYGFDLPSIVYDNNKYSEAYEKIKSSNKSIGQYLGKGSKKSEGQKEPYRALKETLIIYKERLGNAQSADKLRIDPKLKTGQGIGRLAVQNVYFIVSHKNFMKNYICLM